MTASPTVGEWAGTAFAHEAFVYEDDDAVRERCLPYVLEGLDLGQPVIVVAGQRVREMLLARLGERSAELAVLEAAEAAWHGAPATLATHQQTMLPLLESGRPRRLVGEPVWLAYPGGDRWSRYEAIANEAFADYPYYSLCLHDARNLPDVRIEHQLRTHPVVWDDGPRPSETYLPTSAYLRSVEPPWVERPADAHRVVIAHPHDALDQLHHLVERVSPAGRGPDVLLAVYELVTNALKHEVPAEVTHWCTSEGDVWQVSDDGPGMHDPLAGYVPPGPDLDSGRGLWIARGIADDLSVRPTGPGTAVRLYFQDVTEPVTG